MDRIILLYKATLKKYEFHDFKNGKDEQLLLFIASYTSFTSQ